LESMHDKGMYNELLFYVEACESGSIFDGLLKAPNMKVVTAANAKESSYATYCPPSDAVHGKEINSCLGDDFSVHWMEDTDAGGISTETVKQQVDKVTSAVTKSHVQQFGDSSLDTEPLINFQGTTQHNQVLSSVLSTESLVSAREVDLHLAYWAIRRAESAAARESAERKLTAILAERAVADERFLKIALKVVGDEAHAKKMLDAPVSQLGEIECHRSAIRSVEEHCGGFSDYSLRHSLLFANLCDSKVNAATIVKAVEDVCSGTSQLV